MNSPAERDPLEPEHARYFRNDLRAARAAALADSEAFAQPLHCLERLGRFQKSTANSLGKAHKVLSTVAAKSFLAEELPRQWPLFHRPFRALLETVTDSRNAAMHVGARARHLTTHAVELCLILEDALNNGLSRVSDFMVPDPVTAERWQPLSLLRHRLLEHSFTFMPVAPSQEGEDWILVADHQLARYLGDRDGRLDRMGEPVEAALAKGLESTTAEFVDGSESVAEIRQQLGDRPRLVLESGRVVGIVTAFDVL